MGSSMKMEVNLKVTPDNIKCGKRHKPGSCPIAKGLLAAGFEKVLVDGYGMLGYIGKTKWFSGNGSWLEATCPLWQDKFMSNFDEYGKAAVKPFSRKVIFKLVTSE